MRRQHVVKVHGHEYLPKLDQIERTEKDQNDSPKKKYDSEDEDGMSEEESEEIQAPPTRKRRRSVSNHQDTVKTARRSQWSDEDCPETRDSPAAQKISPEMEKFVAHTTHVIQGEPSKFPFDSHRQTRPEPEWTVSMVSTITPGNYLQEFPVVCTNGGSQTGRPYSKNNSTTTPGGHKTDLSFILN